MDFHEIVNEIKTIEKLSEEKKSYASAVVLQKTIDFLPEEFIDKNYHDLLIDYARMLKIAKASGMEFKEVSTPIIKAEKKPEEEIKLPSTELKPTLLPTPEIKAPRIKMIAPEEEKAAPRPEFEFEEETGKEERKISEIKKEKEEKPISREREVSEIRQEEKPEFEEEETGKEERKISEIKKEEHFEFEEETGKEEHDVSEIKKEEHFEFEEEKPHEEMRKISEIKEEETSREDEIKSFSRGEEKPEFEDLETGKEERKISEIKKEEHFEFEEEKPHEEMRKISEIKKEKEVFSRETREVMGEVSEIPYPEKHENVVFTIPPLLLVSPEQAAEKKYTEIEGKIPRIPVKAEEKEIKARMLELTKELFKEKSFSQKEKIKQEIAVLRELLSKKMELPKRTISYATSFFNAMEVDQKMELGAAKESITKQYREQLSKVLNSFSTALKYSKNKEEKNTVYDTFVSNMETLLTKSKALIDRYQSFFLHEHTISLEKVRTISLLKNDKYIADKIQKRINEMKFTYSAEFLSLENAIKKEISSLKNTKKHEVLEIRTSGEMEKLLAIANMKEEELLNYIHANHPDKYSDFETGKITRFELLALAKVLMAKKAKISKESINKYFGESSIIK